MFKKVKKHLKQSNMTYWYHCRHASFYGIRLIITGLKSCVHAVFPCFWKFDGPKTIITIYNEMRKHRHLRRMMKVNKKVSDDRNNFL